MNLVCEFESKRLWAVDLLENSFPEATQLTDAFPCLIYSSQTTDSAFKIAVASRIISAGCQFVACAGLECERWHDVVDEVILAADMMGEHNPEKTILTTWHVEDSIEELAFFFICTTFLPEEDNPQAYYEMESASYLILHLGDSANHEELEAALCGYIRREKT